MRLILREISWRPKENNWFEQPALAVGSSQGIIKLKGIPPARRNPYFPRHDPTKQVPDHFSVIAEKQLNRKN